jgi:hypothetical protein
MALPFLLPDDSDEGHQASTLEAPMVLSLPTQSLLTREYKYESKDEIKNYFPFSL